MSTIDQAANAANWYQNMAVAMRERDKCLAAIERWQTKLAEAEEHIRVLASQVDSDHKAPPAAEPAPTDLGQGVDPDWAESAE